MRESEIADTLRWMDNRTVTVGMIVEAYYHLHPVYKERQDLTVKGRANDVTHVARILRQWVKYGYIEEIGTATGIDDKRTTKLYRIISIPDVD